jgi:quinol monooxygenase YgiN
MPVPVLIGFAGVLVAAAVTGMLAGRCVRQPRIDFILWTGATLGVTVALAAQSMGFARGFGPATFRAVQLPALLLAPLWLAWGLVELAARSGAGRFGMRLVSSALMVVASVILATDPLTMQPFSKSWPLAGSHFEPISRYALDLVQVAAVIAVVVSAGMAAARARSNPRWRRALTGIVPVALAVLIMAGLRFSLPARAAYPLLSMVAAALVWFGVTRIQDLPRWVSGGGQRVQAPEDGYWPDRDYRSEPDHVRDGLYPADARSGPDGHYRADGHYGPEGRYGPDSHYGAEGHYGPDGRGANLGAVPRAQHWPEWDRGAGPGVPSADEQPPSSRSTQTAHSLGAEPVALAGENAEFGAHANAGGSSAARPPRPYGRILIFTLLDDRAADFDRLAEQTAEEVRTGEPDTLVYVIHLVPNAPMQRIFYEIYRDRAALDSHERQPYMQRFVSERRSCVLATNVIELRLKYAKVAPLPNPQPPSPAGSPGARAQLSAGPPQRLDPLPSGSSQGPQVPRGPQRLQPLPPGRTWHPDQRRSDQPLDERWPDQQLPSPGRRYGGI